MRTKATSQSQAPVESSRMSRAANDDPVYLEHLRLGIEELEPGRLMHCIALAMHILRHDRSPKAKTRAWLMLNLLREEKTLRAG